MELLYYFAICMIGISLLLGIRKQIVSLPFLIAALVVLFAFNQNNNDYLGYYRFYEQVRWGQMTYITTNGESSPLFTLSVQFAKLIGLDFTEYRLLLAMILTATGFILLKKCIINI